jgi:glycosyltransferase involved in cell wall biosynthesis
MTTQPLVSVGMPCYNRLVQLQRAIECIVNQTYKNLEIIISNDASPDPRIKPMLDEYAAKDSRIRLYHQQVDLQCYGNYFFVQQQATGKYFMYAQDDDLWEPEFIEVLVDNLEKNPENALAFSASQYIDEQGRPFHEFRFNNQNLITLIVGEKAPIVWMGLFRTDLLRLFDRDKLDISGKDVIIAAEILLSHPYGYVDRLMYSKTLYHHKSKQYISENFFCHFQMYYEMFKRIIKSKYVRHKSFLFVLVPAAGIMIARSYLAQIIYLLPVDHPIRKTIRSLKL